jgi:hypothetical protein
MHPPSGRKLAPLGQGSGAVLLEDVAAVEVAITWAVNSTPRKCLDFKTPAEAFLQI